VIEKGTHVRVKILGTRSEVGEMWAIGSIKEDYLGYVQLMSVERFILTTAPVACSDFWERLEHASGRCAVSRPLPRSIGTRSPVPCGCQQGICGVKTKGGCESSGTEQLRSSTLFCCFCTNPARPHAMKWIRDQGPVTRPTRLRLAGLSNTHLDTRSFSVRHHPSKGRPR
jgi:hypothetical protein